MARCSRATASRMTHLGYESAGRLRVGKPRRASASLAAVYVSRRHTMSQPHTRMQPKQHFETRDGLRAIAAMMLVITANLAC